MPINVADLRILVALGPVDEADALPIGAELAHRTGADLHVVHVWEGAAPRLQPRGEAAARRQLEDAVAELSSAGFVVSETHFAKGEAAQMIVETAQECGATLIVVGTRQHGPFSSLLSGHVAADVVEVARTPVLVTRGLDTWPPERVVAGVDGSAEADLAAELGMAIGAEYECSAELVEALPDVGGMLTETGYYGRVARDILETTRERLDEQAEEYADQLGCVPGVVVSTGEPAAAVLSAAAGSEKRALITVGSRGLGPIQAALFDSVSRRLIRHTPCTLLVVPTRMFENGEVVIGGIAHRSHPAQHGGGPSVPVRPRR